MVLAGLLAALLAAAPPAPVQAIHFPPGRSSTTLAGSVPRGERALFAFRARAGQRLTISAGAVEGNVAFQIWCPSYRLPSVDGSNIAGRALAGAGPEDDAARWSGRLPVSGRYLLVVGATRGSATYQLRLAIK